MTVPSQSQYYKTTIVDYDRRLRSQLRLALASLSQPYLALPSLTQPQLVLVALTSCSQPQQALARITIVQSTIVNVYSTGHWYITFYGDIHKLGRLSSPTTCRLVQYLQVRLIKHSTEPYNVLHNEYKLLTLSLWKLLSKTIHQTTILRNCLLKCFTVQTPKLASIRIFIS